MTEQPPIPTHGAVDLSGLAAPPSSGPAPGAASDHIVEVTEENFRGIVERSRTVPVILNLWAAVSPVSRELTDLLDGLAREYAGRFVLANCDVQAQPAIAQALEVMSVPAVVAILGGRPAPLFQGAANREQVTEILDQVLELAARSGVGPSAPESGEEAVGDEPLPPLHQEAFDAIERGDLEAAAKAYDAALRENPRDADAKAGAALVALLRRTDGVDPDAAVAAADAAPNDPELATAAADADVARGRPREAFARLLTVVAATSGDEREKARVRLVELFEVVGASEPAVIEARRALASALN